MLTPEIKSQINKLWDKFWSGGISNPLTAIEQISYLLFMRRPDDLDLNAKKKADFSNKVYTDGDINKMNRERKEINEIRFNTIHSLQNIY